MESQWEDFWWNNITGPHVVVTDVVNALLENKIVILQVPSDLPWRHAMRGAIHTTFQERSDFRDVIIEPIDIYDDNPEKLEPGKFILDRFATSIIRNGYREKSKISIQKYISTKNVIKNHIIWIKGLDKKSAEKWIKFCRGFSKRSAEEGLFVLEVHEDVPVTEVSPFKWINFSEHVRSYDVQLFNSFILDNQKYYSDDWKKYISTCAASICDIDAELSEQIIHIVDFRTESAADGIKRISTMPEFSRRGEGETSNHILSSYRNGNVSELEHRIWTAQIQVLFPIIELERVRLICKYETNIKEILDSVKITQYGDIIHDPIDVELGTLCYLMCERRDDGYYLLYIPDEVDRNRIKFLHDCRNSLAHVSCCSPEQVQQLLG